MNISQITVFRAVMEAGSISQAARNLGRTQPAISLAIRALEDSLGVSLFHREGRQLIPVPEAYYLLGEAQSILDHMERVRHTMHGLSAGELGSLIIAAMPGPSAYLLPRFLGQELKGRPDVTLSILSRSSPQIVELVKTQKLDFGFLDPLAAPVDTREVQTEVISARCFCAIPAEHELADKTSITLKDLHQIPMATLMPTHNLTVTLHQMFHAEGLEFRRSIDGQFFLPLLHLVASTGCFSIVDPLTVITEDQMQSCNGEVVFRALVEDIRFSYAILSPRDRPSSQLGNDVRANWQHYLLDILTRYGADPQVHG